jgi:hypothetical protein
MITALRPINLNPVSSLLQQANSDEQLIDLLIRRKKSLYTRRTYQIAVKQFRQWIDPGGDVRELGRLHRSC